MPFATCHRKDAPDDAGLAATGKHRQKGFPGTGGTARHDSQDLATLWSLPSSASPPTGPVGLAGLDSELALDDADGTAMGGRSGETILQDVSL
jgi:hypothetical protein